MFVLNETIDGEKCHHWPMHILSVIGKLEWPESQNKSCLNSLQRFPDGMLTIQGFPGTGKTLTLVAMASILLSLGGVVMFTASKRKRKFLRFIGRIKTDHISYAQAHLKKASPALASSKEKYQTKTS